MNQRLDRFVICPGCGEVFTLEGVEDVGGACPECAYRNTNLPNRLLTIKEMLANRSTWDEVCLGAVLRSYGRLLRSER